MGSYNGNVPMGQPVHGYIQRGQAPGAYQQANFQFQQGMQGPYPGQQMPPPPPPPMMAPMGKYICVK